MGSDQPTLPGVDTLPPEALRQTALSQWDTPPWLAEIVAGELPLWDEKAAHVLEPSAGLGNVVAALLARGVGMVTAVEIDPVRVAHLQARFAGCPVHVVCADFLDYATRPDFDFDGIAGNPPYSDGDDTDHLAAIVDVMLRCDTGTAASLLLRTVALHGKERGERVWSRATARVMPVVERVAFGDETGMIDVSVMAIRRGASRLHIRRPT